MSLVILTGSIRHYNIDHDTLEGAWLSTDYHILTNNDIEVIQSWTEDPIKPYPIYKIDQSDLRNSIFQQKGWV